MPIKPPRRSANEQRRCSSPRPKNADAENVTRDIPLRLRASPHTEENDAATLAILPRLPDTRFELISMAEALEADPAKTLYLGMAANEQNVETLDLSHYRIVAFSTHGSCPAISAGSRNRLWR